MTQTADLPIGRELTIVRHGNTYRVLVASLAPLTYGRDAVWLFDLVDRVWHIGTGWDGSTFGQIGFPRPAGNGADPRDAWYRTRPISGTDQRSLQSLLVKISPAHAAVHRDVLKLRRARKVAA